MSPAERRLAEMIEKWLASIEAHFAYLELDDAQYWEARAWPKHERPSRWVLEVARQKLLELRTLCESRKTMGDSRFAEGVELVVFLANLVGLQNIQRFIPLVDSPAELKPSEPAPQPTTPARADTPNGSDSTIEVPRVRKPTPVPASKSSGPPTPLPSGDETTRQMPQISARQARIPSPEAPQLPPRSVARGEARKPAKPADKQPPPVKDIVSAELQSKIVADAVRLMKWGKKWHELPELIARLADRPQAGVIRRVLRTEKTKIESKLAAS
jgi:hypothetical protein